LEAHSGVSTGAVKKASSLTEIVCFSVAGMSFEGVTEFDSPVSVPSSSLSSVCRSIEV
jgi:hypothetical protein